MGNRTTHRRCSVNREGRWQLVAGAALGVLFVVSFAVANERTRPLLLNTLMLAGGAALLSMPLGTLIALLIHRTNLPWRRCAKVLVATMIFVPPYLQVAGWEAGFGFQGWFCRTWFPQQPLAILAGWQGAIWVQTWVNVPWIVLILGSALAGIPSELEEQASLYGSPLQVFRRVTLPLLGPALMASGLAVFVLAANEITITDIYQIRTFAEEIYTGFALGDRLGDIPLRTLPGILMLSGLAVAALLSCANIAKTLSTTGRRKCWQSDLGNYRVLAGTLLVATLIVMVATPLLSLVYQAGLKVVVEEDVRVRHWSLAKALQMIASSPQRFGEEFGWSFALAQLTSVTAITAAVLLAWTARTLAWARALAWILVLIGLALPGPFLALLGGRLLNHPTSDWLFYFYDRTLLLPWFTLSLRLFPVAYLIIDAAVQRMSDRPIELARLTGARLGGIFRHGVWPQLGPVIGCLWLVLIALAIADLSATILAVPPGVTTISIRIFNLVHYGVADQLAGLCLGTVILFGGLAAMVFVFLPTRDSR